MNAEQIAAVMADAVGKPGVGPVADAIPTMADAVAAALGGSTTKTKPAKAAEQPDE